LTLVNKASNSSELERGILVLDLMDTDAAFLEAKPISWQWEMRRAIRDPSELCRRLRLPPRWYDGAHAASGSFTVFAPEPFLSRIEVGNPHDPLLLQILPVRDELQEAPGFQKDPVGDLSAKSVPGLIQKYRGRVLLVLTGACAVHCRYCFRRHFPYRSVPHSISNWLPVLDVIAGDDSIEEVILSGGDPLTLVDSFLRELSTRLNQIPHVRRLRIHTRLPIMIPTRINEDFLDWFTGSRLTPVMVIHANHPNEIDQSVRGSLSRLRKAGVLLLNQSVLLRTINDSVDVLCSLSNILLAESVIPYYLHQLDRVAGAAHFEVPVERGLELLKQLKQLLPGYAVPRYVREIPGHASKFLLA
jgi:EF-P beta-lysylation protein EpmB